MHSRSHKITGVLATICITSMFSLCTKPKVHVLRPIVQITRESRELFGCRINGLPFSPEATDSVSFGTCSYTARYPGEEGFTFKITGNRQEEGCQFSSITITLDSVKLVENQTYRLGAPGDKKNSASYFRWHDCDGTGNTIYTSDDLFGFIQITRVDLHKQIVNGVFDFKMRDDDGEVIRISDGIFDRHFTN